MPCLLSGTLLGLSVNEIAGIPLSPLAWFSLVPLFLLLKNVTNSLVYLLCSYSVCLIFLLFSMFSFIQAYVTGGILMILIGAFIFNIPFICLYFFQRMFGWRKALWLFPFIWPVFVWFFLEQTISLPVLSISTSQASLPWLIQYIDMTGQSGIACWLIFLNVSITLVMDDWKSRQLKSNHIKTVVLTKRLILIAVVFFLPPLLYSAWIKNVLPSKFHGEVRVSLVQSNFVPTEYESDSITALVKIENHVSMTDSLIASDSTDLVIWPEAAIPVPFMQNESVRAYFLTKVLEWNTPLLTGTFDQKTIVNKKNSSPLQNYLKRDYEIYNSAVLITPQLAWMHLKENLDISSLKLYKKQNLMPFTERVPLSETFPVLSNLSIDFGDGANFSSGKGPTYLQFVSRDEQVVGVSPVICWDLLYSIPGQDGTGDEFIAALTNESRLGETFTTTVHEMENFTQLRSIESRRSIAKVSSTGYSFFTDPFGNVYGKLPAWQKGIATDKVLLSSIKTIFSSYPHCFPLLSLLLLVLGIVIFKKDKLKI